MERRKVTEITSSDVDRLLAKMRRRAPRLNKDKPQHARHGSPRRSSPA
jgi:hypothetical protein